MGIIYVILGVPAKQMVRIAISLTVAYNGYVEILYVKVLQKL